MSRNRPSPASPPPSPPSSEPLPSLAAADSSAADPQLAAELEGLGREADGLAGAAPAGEGVAAPPRDARMFQVQAAGMVAMVASLAKMVTGITYSASTQAEVTDALAPVLAKYDGRMPSWLLAYQEELRLGMVLAGVGFNTWKMIDAAKKQEAADAAANDAAKPAAAS